MHDRGRLVRMRRRALLLAAIVGAEVLLAPDAAPMNLAKATDARAQSPRTGAQLSGAAAGQAPGIQQWVRIETLLSFTDAQLDKFRAWGIRGFTTGGFRMRSMSGGDRFTGDPNLAALANGAEYALQRRIRDSNIAARLAARGMTLVFRVYASNYFNSSTPFLQWNDDGRWAAAIPEFEHFAAMMRLYGVSELIFDLEEYPTREDTSGAGFTWAWNYPATPSLPGNTASEAVTRANVKKRGAQIMTALVAGYPGINVGAYYMHVPGTHREWVDHITYNPTIIEPYLETEVGGTSRSVFRNFMDGLTSVEGYSRFRLLDEGFYKSVGVPNWTWDQAYRNFVGRWHARMSRLMSNWDYLASRLVGGGMVWPDPGPGASNGYRGAASVTEQMTAAARWSEGGVFDAYGQHFPGDSAFSYESSGLVSAYQRSAALTTVDSQPPTLAITSSARTGNVLAVSGVSGDDYGVRRVSWTNSAGGRGESQMTPVLSASGEHTGAGTMFEESIPLVAGSENRITLTAEDIHGLASSTTIQYAASRSARRALPRVRGLRTESPIRVRTARRHGIRLSFVAPAGARIIHVKLSHRSRALLTRVAHARKAGRRQVVKLVGKHLRRDLRRGRYALAVRAGPSRAQLSAPVGRTVVIV